MSEAQADLDTYTLPPTQAMVMEVLIARARLGETCWTFPNSVRPALNALADRGLLWWKSAPTYGHCQAFLTDAGRAELGYPYEPPAIRDLQDLLGNVSLYIPWQWVTQQLTTEQKDLFADAVDAWSARLNPGDPAWVAPADRWWRDGVSQPNRPATPAS